MKYVPYHQLDAQPNIIVDGRAAHSTRLTLSHWPGNSTPVGLKADLSAEIVFNYLDNPQEHIDVPAASNNHFDEDGLVGLWALLNPDEAQDWRDFLLEVAAAGDFGVCRNRDAARVSFILSAWNTPELSPLKESVFKQPYSEVTMILYEELLPRFHKILERYESLERFWRGQDQILDRSEEQISSGAIVIKETPHLDLAVVDLPFEKRDPQKKEEVLLDWDQLVHPIAVHNSTDCKRILLVHGNRYRFYYRYESWVEYISSKIAPRIDLTDLAVRLSTADGANEWKYDGNDAIVPKLEPANSVESSIERAQLIEVLSAVLEDKVNAE